MNKQKIRKAIKLIEAVTGKKVTLKENKKPLRKKPVLNEMARKVTDTIVNAFFNGENKKVGNSFTTRGKLYLHDNLIAEISGNTLTIYDGGYKSNTTKERLNGVLSNIGYGIRQVKGEWFLIGDDGSKKEFENGMSFNI